MKTLRRNGRKTENVADATDTATGVRGTGSATSSRYPLKADGITELEARSC